METAPKVKKTERGPTWPGRGLTKLRWPEPHGQTGDLSSDSKSKLTQNMCLANFFIFGRVKGDPADHAIRHFYGKQTWTGNRRKGENLISHVKSAVQMLSPVSKGGENGLSLCAGS